MKPRLGCRFWVFPRWASRLLAMNTGAGNPLLLFGEIGVEPGLDIPERQQENGCHYKVLALRLGHMAGYKLSQLGHKSYCPQRLHGVWLWYPQRFLKLQCCLWRIVLSHLALVPNTETGWVTWRRRIFHVVVSGVEASELILWAVLRQGVLSKRDVDAAGWFKCFPSTFKVVEHNVPSIELWQVHSYSALGNPWNPASTYNIHIY